MTWPNIGVSQINRFNGTTKDVERVVLYVGYGETNTGKTQALNTGTDLDKALGWQGAIFHANAYQIHGEGLSAHNLDNLLTVSNIEARPATKSPTSCPGAS